MKLILNALLPLLAWLTMVAMSRVIALWLR